ncbi:helix-turn-helix domain-containing protein [Neorhizobium alkalisoli]|uniref:helix-turn-helix domain-containing protein n=1 Tax=Neorhizobium alkalisoli TaxID=528178 RepID=UPI000CF97FE0|nr:helix-turn-helix domain-containing protein [Neorhizobium alkalisoli]
MRSENRSQQSTKPDIIDVEVGEKIRSRRRALGITQKKLADSVGVTFQQIQKYEKGANRVGASRLLQIANVLTVSASFLFPNERKASAEKKEQAEYHPYADLLGFLESSEGSELNAAFARIRSPAIRARTVALIKTIAEAGPDR